MRAACRPRSDPDDCGLSYEDWQPLVTVSSMAVSTFSSLIFSMIISYTAVFIFSFIVITVCHRLF